MKTNVLILFPIALILVGCESKKDKEAKFWKTPQGKLIQAQAKINVGTSANAGDYILKGYNELDSVRILFPGTKEARIADSIIKNHNTIYTETERNKENLIKENDENNLPVRQKHETYLRNYFLDCGLDIKVKITGENYTNLTLNYVLFNDVWFRKFETQELFDKWAALGFQKITLTDGFNYSRSVTNP